MTVISKSYDSSINMLSLEFDYDIQEKDYLADINLHFELQTAEGTNVADFRIESAKRSSINSKVLDIKVNKPEELADFVLTIKITNDMTNYNYPIRKDDHHIFKSALITYPIKKDPIGEPISEVMKASAVVASSASNAIVVVAMAINLPIAVYLMKLI